MTFCRSYRTTISIGCIVPISIYSLFIEENGSFKIFTRKEAMALSEIGECFILPRRDE